VLGQGAFGEVWLAKERSPAKGKAAKYLAVKMMSKSDASIEDGEAFLAECEIMALLRHPNLLRMHGVSIRQQPWLVVIDFITYGDMHQVLRTCRAKKIPLRYSEQYFFAAQIALGMRYGARFRKEVLHSRMPLVTRIFASAFLSGVRCSYRCHRKLCRNAEGIWQCTG
jgi:serine/threonine protein kinase